jgi:hypothetical protein
VDQQALAELPVPGGAGGIPRGDGFLCHGRGLMRFQTKNREDPPVTVTRMKVSQSGR